jgi:hypothetical protein
MMQEERRRISLPLSRKKKAQQKQTFAVAYSSFFFLQHAENYFCLLLSTE